MQLDLLPGPGEQMLGGLEQGSQFGPGEAVVDRAAVRTAVDQVGLFQDGQVGGDVGLGAAELGGQVDDAVLPGLQGEQDGQPSGIGRGAEQLGGQALGRQFGQRERVAGVGVDRG